MTAMQEETRSRRIGPVVDASLLSGTMPVTVIRPSRGWISLNLRDLWEYRELLYFLTWRDIKVRYKQTVLGAAWAIIQPFFTKFPLDAPQLAGGRKAGSPQANSRLQRVRNCGTVRICVLLDEAVMRSTI